MIHTHTHTDRLQATIGKPEYVRIGRCLFKAMMPTWDEAQAQQSAEDDWEQDAKGKPTIDRRGFGESMFQVGSRPAAAGLPSALMPPPRADTPPPARRAAGRPVDDGHRPGRVRAVPGHAARAGNARTTAAPPPRRRTAAPLPHRRTAAPPHRRAAALCCAAAPAALHLCYTSATPLLGYCPSR